MNVSKLGSASTTLSNTGAIIPSAPFPSGFIPIALVTLKYLGLLFSASLTFTIAGFLIYFLARKVISFLPNQAKKTQKAATLLTRSVPPLKLNSSFKGGGLSKTSASTFLPSKKTVDKRSLSNSKPNARSILKNSLTPQVAPPSSKARLSPNRVRRVSIPSPPSQADSLARPYSSKVQVAAAFFLVPRVASIIPKRYQTPAKTASYPLNQERVRSFTPEKVRAKSPARPQNKSRQLPYLSSAEGQLYSPRRNSVRSLASTVSTVSARSLPVSTPPSRTLQALISPRQARRSSVQNPYI